MKFDQDIKNINNTINNLKASGAKNFKIIVNIYTAGIMVEYLNGYTDNDITFEEVEPDIYYMGKLLGVDVYVNKANTDLKDYIEIECDTVNQHFPQKIDLDITTKLID